MERERREQCSIIVIYLCVIWTQEDTRWLISITPTIIQLLWLLATHKSLLAPGYHRATASDPQTSHYGEEEEFPPLAVPGAGWAGGILTHVRHGTPPSKAPTRPDFLSSKLPNSRIIKISLILFITARMDQIGKLMINIFNFSIFPLTSGGLPCTFHWLRVKTIKN